MAKATFLGRNSLMLQLLIFSKAFSTEESLGKLALFKD
jgi:hypothetical protein